MGDVLGGISNSCISILSKYTAEEQVPYMRSAGIDAWGQDVRPDKVQSGSSGGSRNETPHGSTRCGAF